MKNNEKVKEKDTKQSVFTLIHISFAFSATAEMFANVMKPDCENVLSLHGGF